VVLSQRIVSTRGSSRTCLLWTDLVFKAADLAPAVRDFYEHTSAYRLEVWTGWRPIFWIGGELIARYFCRRVEQLALPMRALDVAQGMDSTITVITGPDGRQREAAWLRTLRAIELQRRLRDSLRPRRPP
jgi:hypothetical protein